MSTSPFVSSDEIRSRFSRAMSNMYREEVPQYAALLDLVADINAEVLEGDPALKSQLQRDGSLGRLGVERHGAIRVGTAEELATLRRLFAVMGMFPVGYYDLSVAGVPVHSTAFRPVSDESLARNPFRVFTSLLRLELIADVALRSEAAETLARRKIFTERALRLIDRFEVQGGLDSADADEFVKEALKTFCWHGEATVDAKTYDRLHDAHRLIADVVCFKGPHINHLTPRTLDIDAAQAGMPRRGIAAKDIIEGPPRRKCPILLRQTSFKALEEVVMFERGGQDDAGTHMARFGEIEQRGVALTRAGRKLYDETLSSLRTHSDGNSVSYEDRLAKAFLEFPDDHESLRKLKLAHFRYSLTPEGEAAAAEQDLANESIDTLIERGFAKADPMTYEDFLPVSAAGIFQSNLGGTEQKSYAANAARAAFEEALNAPVFDEIALYAENEIRSLAQVRAALGAREKV